MILKTVLFLCKTVSTYLHLIKEYKSIVNGWLTQFKQSDKTLYLKNAVCKRSSNVNYSDTTEPRLSHCAT